MTDFFSYAESARKVVTLNVENLGKVDIKELSCSDRDEFDIELAEVGKNNMRGIRAAYVFHCAFKHGTDERVFKGDDLDRLNKCPSRFLSKMFDAAAKLNGAHEDLDNLKKE